MSSDQPKIDFKILMVKEILNKEHFKLCYQHYVFWWPNTSITYWDTFFIMSLTFQVPVGCRYMDANLVIRMPTDVLWPYSHQEGQWWLQFRYVFFQVSLAFNDSISLWIAWHHHHWKWLTWGLKISQRFISLHFENQIIGSANNKLLFCKNIHYHLWHLRLMCKFVETSFKSVAWAHVRVWQWTWSHWFHFKMKKIKAQYWNSFVQFVQCKDPLLEISSNWLTKLPLWIKAFYQIFCCN